MEDQNFLIQTKKEIISTLIILALFPNNFCDYRSTFAAIEDVPFQDAFFEAAGIITTGGLSAGVIDNRYRSSNNDRLRILMIFGRLEIIAIIYIFVPRLS